MAATATSNPHSGRRKKAAAASNKNTDKWTDEEQTQFKQGIIKHGWGNWKVLLEENIITTRDRSQIKSRAQKLKKNHPDAVADLIRQHEACKNAGATKSVVNKVSVPSSTKKSTKPSTTTTTAPTTKKKKAPQRRRGSTSSVKCKSPVSSQAASSTITTTSTNKMRRRGSCPGNLGMEGRVVCKLQPGGGAIAKRRGSLRNSLRASFKATPPSPSTPKTKKQSVSPQSPVEQHLDISPDVTSVTAGVNSVNLGMDAAAAAAAVVITPNASSNPSPTDFMMPIAQQQDDKEGSEEEEEDELVALAKAIKEPSWKLKPTFSNNPSDNSTAGSDDASFNSTSVHDGGSDNRSVNMNIDDLGDFDLENILVETSNNSPEKKENVDEFIEPDVDKGVEDINMEPLPKDDVNTTAVEEKHLKMIARFVDPRLNTAQNAPQGLARNQTMSFGMPSSPNIRPEQNLYMSIHTHMTSPPNFSDPKEYVETQNGLTRIAKDTGTVCRARIKSLLNEHLEMGWWREDYINPVNNTNDTQLSFGNQNDGKKFGLERLVALTAVMLDVDNWHAINKVQAATAAASPFANVASLSADDEDDIRHVGQLISGLWERVIRALERGHAFPGNEASRITAINIAVARLDWYSRKEQKFGTAHQPMSH